MNPPGILLKWLAPQAGERVLDIGCGLGANSALLAAAGALVTGIDPEGHLLEQAQLACPSGRFIPVTLERFGPEEQFDAVLAHAVLHWMGPPGPAFAKIAKLLKPGGRIAGSYGAKAEESSFLVNYYLPEADECRAALLDQGLGSIRIESWARGWLVYARKPE